MFPEADFAARRSLECVHIGRYELRAGDHVRIRPRAGGDILDIALRDKLATIASIEQDVEDRIYLAVTLDDDPGADLGFDRMIGHRFFFAPEELEPLFDVTELPPTVQGT